MEHLPVVLVIEDDELILSVVEEALTEGGYETVIASSGENAVKLLDASDGKYQALKLAPGSPALGPFLCDARESLANLSTPATGGVAIPFHSQPMVRFARPVLRAFHPPMPLRRKPVSRLPYWSGGTPSQSKVDGFRTILVYCVGPPTGPRCWHWSAVKLDDLPEWGLVRRLRTSQMHEVW
jgi:CheY-like chemotaxis protein